MTRIPLWLITLIIGFTLGFVISKPHQTSANVRTGYETLSVVVTLHDTIRTVKTVHDVRTSMHLDTICNPDTEYLAKPKDMGYSAYNLTRSSSVLPCKMYRDDKGYSSYGITDSISIDTAHCYTINEHEKDGAYIAATLCSRYFTALPPPDLKGIITYQPPPDTQRTILRTDTLTHTKTNWSITAIAACAGIVAGILVRR